MNKDKILINITDLDDLNSFKEEGITNFLFPLAEFSVGYDAFSLEEIENTQVHAYILANRLLTDDDIDEFLKLKLPDNVVGLIVEDVGLYYALKGSNLELINFQNHLNNNYKTVNYWLQYYDSLVLSTDITFEEAEKIVSSASKPLVVYTLGYPEIMYSRRLLLKNYYDHLGSEPKKEERLSIPNNSTQFILKESEEGTCVFPNTPLDARDEVIKYDESKIKFYLIDTNMLDKTVILAALHGKRLDSFDKGFLYKKTIYRVGDIK